MRRELNIWARTHANYDCWNMGWKYHFWMMIACMTDERRHVL